MVNVVHDGRMTNLKCEFCRERPNMASVATVNPEKGMILGTPTVVGIWVCSVDHAHKLRDKYDFAIISQRREKAVEN